MRPCITVTEQSVFTVVLAIEILYRYTRGYRALFSLFTFQFVFDFSTLFFGLVL